MQKSELGPVLGPAPVKSNETRVLLELSFSKSAGEGALILGVGSTAFLGCSFAGVDLERAACGFCDSFSIFFSISFRRLFVV